MICNDQMCQEEMLFSELASCVSFFDLNLTSRVKKTQRDVERDREKNRLNEMCECECLFKRVIVRYREKESVCVRERERWEERVIYIKSERE